VSVAESNSEICGPQSRIDDCQKNDILALVAKACRLHVDAPGAGALPGNAIDQW
jgi:hypothetical protein